MSAVAVSLTMAAAGCTGGPSPIRVGAIYPLSGSQGAGGIDEFKGVTLAVDMVNAGGGLHGHPIRLEPTDVSSGDAAPGAVDALADKGIRFVVGSYGSTISAPAAAEATSRGMLFWETGAVGATSMSMPGAGPGSAPDPRQLFFRVAPSGSTLGRAAMSFIADELTPLLHRSASSLRFAVANVDDAYGDAVAEGAVAEVHALGLPLAGQFPYDPLHLDAPALVRAIAAGKPDVLFVSAYLKDGVALRQEMVRQRLHLLASIGTSSSYCMPDFGEALGQAAVGLFASDKPDGDALGLSGLAPDARALLQRARVEYRARYRQEMSAPALAGFSAAWALFHSVMPAASATTPQAVAQAALSARIPAGGLPNGSGLEFGAPGTPEAGANLRAASVIWEWVGVNRRAVVWPPQFATQRIEPIPIEL